MAGRFCPVCHVPSERWEHRYICPECGRVVMLARPRPLGWLAVVMQKAAEQLEADEAEKVSES